MAEHQLAACVLEQGLASVADLMQAMFEMAPDVVYVHKMPGTFMDLCAHAAEALESPLDQTIKLDQVLGTIYSAEENAVLNVLGQALWGGSECRDKDAECMHSTPVAAAK